MNFEIATPRAGMTGTPINGFDPRIASICRAHRCDPRHVKDFLSTGIDLIDPWNDEP